jgi:sugar phosphate permease
MLIHISFTRRYTSVRGCAGALCRYTTFYLTRGSLTYSAPSMVADPNLGFTLAHIGTMTSIFPMAYGVSKFAAGALL